MTPEDPKSPGAPQREPLSTTFDVAPLTRPVSRSEVKAFRTAARASGDPRWKGRGKWVIWFVTAIFAVVVPLVIGVNLWALADLERSGALAIAGALFAVIVVGGSILSVRGQSGTWARYLRGDEFARANRMKFEPHSPVPAYQGAIFGIGSSRKVLTHVWSSDGPVADCGTYCYTTGSGKNRTTHRWQFAAVRLAGPLPHMLLDAKANNTFFGSNLPAAFHRNQRISLGGEFDEHFDLYCPQSYGHDAFYVFTPDLMAQLIDQTSAFDVEFVDDWMFLYTRQDLSVTDPGTWHRLARISDTITARMRDRSRSYTDQRVPAAATPGAAPLGAGPVRGPRTVAPQGRRLRRKRVWLPLVLVGGWMLLNLFGQADNVFDFVRRLLF